MSDKQFVHVVNFWLKPGLSEADILLFEKGVRSLGEIETVQFYHLGKPASTDREVIDRSYSYCLVEVFKNKEDHDAYQVHPIHDRFREACGHLWDRVQIFDSETV